MDALPLPRLCADPGRFRCAGKPVVELLGRGAEGVFVLEDGGRSLISPTYARCKAGAGVLSLLVPVSCSSPSSSELKSRWKR